MNTMYKMINNKKGFTLIELIIVIAIIAILAAVAIPRLGGFTDKAKQNTDAANKKMLANVAAIAVADGKIAVPATGTTKVFSADGTTPEGSIDWDSATSELKDYLTEWPTRQQGSAFIITIDDKGKVTVTP